jgi:predicted amidophosphoribosyltransferase
MATLTVHEASATYQRAMRNVPPIQRGICATCRTFVDPAYRVCRVCSRRPERLDLVVPISYSEHGGQLHLALRRYKDGLRQEQRYAMPRLAAILWRFLAQHEHCVRATAGIDKFDLVTTVPSSTPEDDDRRANFRWVVEACEPVASRYDRVLKATGDAPAGRSFDPARYRATRSLRGAAVLLADDTWAGGGHALSAADALLDGGATSVALVVIGRHLRRDWQVSLGGPTCGELFDALPRPFDWGTCAAE